MQQIVTLLFHLSFWVLGLSLSHIDQRHLSVPVVLIFPGAAVVIALRIAGTLFYWGVYRLTPELSCMLLAVLLPPVILTVLGSFGSGDLTFFIIIVVYAGSMTAAAALLIGGMLLFGSEYAANVKQSSLLAPHNSLSSAVPFIPYLTAGTALMTLPALAAGADMSAAVYMW